MIGAPRAPRAATTSTTGGMHERIAHHAAGARAAIGGRIDAARARAGARTAGAVEGELFLRRRQDRPLGRRQPDGRPHVRRVHDPAAAASSLSDRDGARRQPDRHQLHRHARRPRGLGAIFRAPRLRGLRGRPGGARTLRALVAAARSGAAAAVRFRRAALRRARAFQAVAAGASAHAVAGNRAGWRSRISTSSMPRSFPRS